VALEAVEEAVDLVFLMLGPTFLRIPNRALEALGFLVGRLKDSIR
jgi:hypothetical protein